MTLDELEASADAIAARRADPRTSELVRRAFLTPGALTLRKYLALEEEGSPLLSGNWPWEDPEAMAHAFCTAYAILFPEREIPPANLVGAAIAEMVAEVTRGFSTVTNTPMASAGSPASWPGSSPLASEIPWTCPWIGCSSSRLPWPPTRAQSAQGRITGIGQRVAIHTVTPIQKRVGPKTIRRQRISSTPER